MTADLSRFIRPGDGVVIGQACAEPQTLLEALVEQRAQLSGCRVFLGVNYSGIVKPPHSDHLRLASYGGAVQPLTMTALAELGIDESIDSGPVTARPERANEVRAAKKVSAPIRKASS